MREVPKLKEITASMDGPLELCCPITLLLFQDPVKTLHGQTYERAAIEDWLESKSTDPMTGDILKIKALGGHEEWKAVDFLDESTWAELGGVQRRDSNSRARTRTQRCCCSAARLSALPPLCCSPPARLRLSPP